MGLALIISQCTAMARNPLSPATPMDRGGLIPSHNYMDAVEYQLFIVTEGISSIEDPPSGRAMSVCCCCCCGCSVWERAAKAYQFMSEILSVTHTHADAADGTRKPSKMDISRLEEQYLCTKQRQKQGAHIIVFKAGENELIPGEPVMNTVPVNKTIKKPKAFKDRAPVRDVTLEVLNKNYLYDRDGTWHAHLNMHRMAQLDHQSALENDTADHEKETNHENNMSQCGSRLQSYEDLPNQADHPMKERKASSSSVESSPYNNRNRKISLKQAMTASWAQYHFPSSKLTSPTDKVFYYPFPQKKTPRISETARKLGLYVTH
uniref:TBC1 domain-containing protein n=1 Tax=Leptobrachium leishanense TaxID=445787 RepID=A0A8C5PLG2_9ANUR